MCKNKPQRIDRYLEIIKNSRDSVRKIEGMQQKNGHGYKQATHRKDNQRTASETMR